MTDLVAPHLWLVTAGATRLVTGSGNTSDGVDLLSRLERNNRLLTANDATVRGVAVGGPRERLTVL